MNLPRQFALNNGESVPAIGLGTFQGDAGNAAVVEQVKTALKLGYRHVDTAMAYGNEKAVGQALQESGVPREELFITTKLAQAWHRPEDISLAIEESLSNLGLQYVDLYLMHFPQAYTPGQGHSTIRKPDGKPLMDLELSRNYVSTWQAMEELVDSGKTRAIGLSNFNILKTKRILELARIRPAVNQVELHPFFPQKELVDFCSSQGILVMAHQPLGGAPVAVVRDHSDVPAPLHHPLMMNLASSSGKTTAQLCLSWAVQGGIPVVPKTVNEERMRQNLELEALDDDVFKAVDNIVKETGPIRFLNPSRHIGFDIFDEENDQPVEVSRGLD